MTRLTSTGHKSDSETLLQNVSEYISRSEDFHGKKNNTVSSTLEDPALVSRKFDNKSTLNTFATHTGRSHGSEARAIHPPKSSRASLRTHHRFLHGQVSRCAHKNCAVEKSVFDVQRKEPKGRTGGVHLSKLPQSKKKNEYGRGTLTKQRERCHASRKPCPSLKNGFSSGETKKVGTRLQASEVSRKSDRGAKCMVKTTKKKTKKYVKVDSSLKGKPESVRAQSNGDSQNSFLVNALPDLPWTPSLANISQMLSEYFNSGSYNEKSISTLEPEDSVTTLMNHHTVLPQGHLKGAPAQKKTILSLHFPSGSSLVSDAGLSSSYNAEESLDRLLDQLSELKPVDSISSLEEAMQADGYPSLPVNRNEQVGRNERLDSRNDDATRPSVVSQPLRRTKSPVLQNSELSYDSVLLDVRNPFTGFNLLESPSFYTSSLSNLTSLSNAWLEENPYEGKSYSDSEFDLESYSDVNFPLHSTDPLYFSDRPKSRSSLRGDEKEAVILTTPRSPAGMNTNPDFSPIPWRCSHIEKTNSTSSVRVPWSLSGTKSYFNPNFQSEQSPLSQRPANVRPHKSNSGRLGVDSSVLGDKVVSGCAVSDQSEKESKQENSGTRETPISSLWTYVERILECFTFLFCRCFQR